MMDLVSQEVEGGVLWTGLANLEIVKWLSTDGTVPTIRSVLTNRWIGVELVDPDGTVVAFSTRRRFRR
jgi:hypothetical protein